MKASLDETADATEQVESLRLELERCQRELDEYRKRAGEPEQAEALLAGENRVLEMIAKGESLPSILNEVCRLVEEISSGSLCSILLLDPNDNRLWHSAAPSLPASYSSAFDGRTIGPRTGPCGRAAYFKEPVIVSDIATDPMGDDYRDLALAHGLRACWSTPIFSSEGKVLGSFAVLAREPRSPTQQHQRIIAQITHLAAVAIERKRAEDSLRRSEAYLAEAERLNHTGSWAYDVVRQVSTYWSPERCRISGFDPAQGPPPLDRERATHTAESWSNRINTIDRAIREKADFQTDSCLVFPDGSIKHLHIVGHPILNPAGDVVELVGSTTDVTATRQAGVLLAGEKRLLEMIARGDSLSTILTELCHLFEELCGGSFSSILLLDPDTRQLRHGAAPSLPKKYIEAIDGGVIGPSAGSCGTAAYRGTPVVVPDIATDPLWADYRNAALAHGLRACWSSPILSVEKSVLGTFAIYYREPRRPASQQQTVIDQITHLASIALERKRAEETLRRSEAYLAEAQRLSLTGSFGWMVSSGKLIWSDETFCLLGYDRAMKPTLELVFKRVHPEDLGLVQQTIERATHEKTSFDFEHRLLMPDGGIKHLHVVAHPARTDSGEMEFVGAVMDITERKRAEEALRASGKFARGQAEALTQALEALARESSPDRIVEHVLRTITTQLEAHSCSVWLRNEADGLVVFEFAFENNKLVTKSDAVITAISPSLKVEEVWPWPKVFRTGKPHVLQDIREGPMFPWREHVLSLGVITILVVPMLVAGRVEGVVGIRFTSKRAFRTEEMELAQALANQTMLALQLTRLSAQSRQSAVMAERNRMARDMHDTLAQGFTGVIVQLEAAADATSKGLTKEAEEHLARAGDLARESLREARRSVRALRPRALEDKDLCEALGNLIRTMTAGTTVKAEFIVQGEIKPLPPEWDQNLLRIGQEVLTNVLRHAQASRFKAQIAFAPDAIRLELRDNGHGFDPAGRSDGFGLLGMRERVEGMGGRLTIESSAGTGTAISIVLPLPETLPTSDS